MKNPVIPLQTSLSFKLNSKFSSSPSKNKKNFFVVKNKKIVRIKLRSSFRPISIFQLPNILREQLRITARALDTYLPVSLTKVVNTLLRKNPTPTLRTKLKSTHLRITSRLDAFSSYYNRTWLPSV